MSLFVEIEKGHDGAILLTTTSRLTSELNPPQSRSIMIIPLNGLQTSIFFQGTKVFWTYTISLCSDPQAGLLDSSKASSSDTGRRVGWLIAGLVFSFVSYMRLLESSCCRCCAAIKNIQRCKAQRQRSSKCQPPRGKSEGCGILSARA